MRRLAALSMFVAAVAMLPSLASAENFYVILRGGPGFTPDINIGAPGGEEPDGFGTGFTGGAAVGYAFPFGLRAEGEFGFILAPVKTDGGVEATGSFKNYLMMANAYYDLSSSDPSSPSSDLASAARESTRTVRFLPTASGGSSTSTTGARSSRIRHGPVSATRSIGGSTSRWATASSTSMGATRSRTISGSTATRSSTTRSSSARPSSSRRGPG